MAECVDGECQCQGDQSCVGECTASPVDFLTCDSTDLTNKSVSCTQDTDCPALVGLPECTTDSDCPSPTKCVEFGGKPAPGQPPLAKVCRQICDSGTCTGPPCTTNADCNTSALTGTFMQCDLVSGSPTFQTCVSTYASLFEGAGLNGQSCYIPYYTGQVNPSVACNGCPTGFGGNAGNKNWPKLPSGDNCRNSNSDWTTIVEPLIQNFKKACPSAYSFPFDDPTSTFQCTNDVLTNSTPYTITFCPNNVIDKDADGINN